MKYVVTHFFGFLIVVCFSLCVQAQTQSFRITDIRVEGLQRVSAGTVFGALPVRVGDTVSSLEIQQAIRELFKVGLFTDVSIGRDGGVLVLILKERPAINEIEIEGNKVIKTDQLMESLTDNGLSEGQIYQSATLNSISQALTHEYISQGRYGASVTIEIEDLPRNQVKITVVVDEGEVARIKKINVIGNVDFDDETLMDAFELSTTNWTSWLMGNDKYSKEKLTGDLETLESFYLDRGYLGFTIDSTQVTLSPDHAQVFITMNITEGDIYMVSDVELAGDPAISEALIRRMILMRKDDTFSQIRMTTSSEYITDRLGNEGYTFAEVEGIPERNDEDHTVKITFFINPGKRAYVRRINFRGNTSTQDEVLRREMRQMEGGSASTAQIEHSKVRLERLGFFKEVTVDTVEVPGTPDQVDVEFTVEEQTSGSVGLQLGYGEYYGATISANLQENNWLGTGKQVGVSVSRSKFQTSYNFNYNDPYFTPDGVSRGFNIYYYSSDYSRANVAGFNKDAFGGLVRFGYPISDIERLSFDFGFRNLRIKPHSYSSREIVRPRINTTTGTYITQTDIVDFIDNTAIGINTPLGTYDALPVTDAVLGEPGFLDEHGTVFHDFVGNISWLKSTLNRGILPTRGASQQIGIELALPGGDLEYYKLTYNAKYFKALTRSLTLALRTSLGYADSYGGTSELPFFEHFYAGGFGSVRGFERNSLGPRPSPQEVYYTTPSAWDDFNGDGYVGSDETFGNTYILCQDPSLSGAPSGGVCRPGELVTQVANNITDRTRSFGGNFLVEMSAAVIFPLPFIEDQRSFQASLFIDAGNVFDSHCNRGQSNCYDFSWDKISVAAGLGLTWISAFGPMTFSLTETLNSNPFDRQKSFNFSLGNTF